MRPAKLFAKTQHAQHEDIQRRRTKPDDHRNAQELARVGICNGSRTEPEDYPDDNEYDNGDESGYRVQLEHARQPKW